MQKINRIGQKFGRLEIIGESPPKGRRTTWLCQCDCGVTKVIDGDPLARGKIQSCGCFRREQLAARSTSHGDTINRLDTKEYRCWCKMKERCYNPNSARYNSYGARGIKVCQEWHSFASFLKDMGRCPPNRSIDRIDVNGDYEPSNCRWATQKEQSGNKQSSLKTSTGECLRQYCDRVGLIYKRVHQRMKRNRLTVDEAIALYL